MWARARALWEKIKVLRERNTLRFDLFVIAGLITFLILVAFYEFDPGAMTILATNLSEADRMALALRLRRHGIKYSLSQDSISVPARDLSRAQSLLAGVPSFAGGTTGFSLFDQNGFGRSDFEEQVAYQRSLQGELERTIMDIRGIESARVMLAMPRPSPFAIGEAEAARASVFLVTAPGAAIDSAVAGAIAHLVASSVHGLSPEAVTVTVNDGIVLYPPPVQGGALTEVIRVREEIERRLKNKVSNLLQRIMGSSRFAVEVAVTLDTSHSSAKEEIFGDGSNRTILSEQHSSEPPPTVMGGIPGLTSNLPRPSPSVAPSPAATPTPGTTSGTSVSTVSATLNQTPELVRKDIINYQPSKREISTTSGPFRIVRISTAVVLDGTYEGGVFTPLPPKRLDSIRNLVAAAVGAQLDRGDIVDVESAALSRPYVPPPPSPFVQLRVILSEPTYLYGTVALLTVVALGLVWGIMRLLRRKRRERVARVSAPIDLLKRTRETPEGPEALRPIEDIDDYDRLRQEINQEAESDPEAVAALLRSWMAQAGTNEEGSSEETQAQKAA